ncbi:hypothetical protein [Ulvibacter litoralis]|uniref:Uncharacterized protein n=1 Tax=Ulvibacter litoralis TaxID=227084 RepID=A0A1G7HII7_9FLAO|nr:hypothetical protein [Ulvibacter litoralis]GHC57970.1 hypothetical protein GCM10008083_23270 [Ulvibacter litoralis]SDF00300.1 hypothetical protein SAMN05421855_104117 [Ulvibacter litoralis]
MGKPAKCITEAAARQLQDNWVATRASSIQNSLGVQDTREFVYSVEELQEFLDYVREQSLKDGVSSPGIRFYFAAYNSDTSTKATMFMSPTKGIAANSPNNYNIAPMNAGIGGHPPTNY